MTASVRDLSPADYAAALRDAIRGALTPSAPAPALVTPPAPSGVPLAGVRNLPQADYEAALAAVIRGSRS